MQDDGIGEGRWDGRTGMPLWRGPRVRPIRASDSAALLRGWRALGREGRLFRLRSGGGRIGAAEALRFATPGRGEICLVIDGQGALAGELAAGARVAGVGPGLWGELAVSARPEVWGQGLAGRAVAAALEAARASGCAGVVAAIDGRNRPMLRLARRFGMTLARDPDDPATVEARLGL